MSPQRIITASALAAVWTFSPLAHSSENNELQELRGTVERQQRELNQLKEKLDATANMLDHAGEDMTKPSSQMATSGSPPPFKHGSTGKTVVGGYGELHYNNLENQLAGGSDKKEIDLHRVVFFVGHEFSDRIRFWSELEVEHSFLEDENECSFDVPAGGLTPGSTVSCEGDSAPGEVAMEQAYLEFDLTPELAARGGLLLIPVGLLNETHEPPNFYGVERNPVESRIVPSTWREAGASLSGRFGQGWSYDLAAHSGLEASAGSKYAVRSARQAAGEAPADDLAYTARLKWAGIPGLEVAGTLQYQTDITQGTDSTAGAATLAELHAVWAQGPFGVRALYATWDLDGSGPAAAGADEQTGWYIEPSFKFTPQAGVFARYNQWDNQAGDSADSEYKQVDVGVNYWPHPDVVIKADYQDQSSPDGKSELDGVNLGVGYQF